MDKEKKRKFFLSMDARRVGYQASYNHLPENNPQKEVFKQLTLEMTHWCEMFLKAFPEANDGS